MALLDDGFRMKDVTMEVVGYAPDEWLIEEAGLGVLSCFNEEFCCEYETRPVGVRFAELRDPDSSMLVDHFVLLNGTSCHH